MIFLDHAAVVQDRRSFSARGAGILGLLPFGRRPIYALRDDMSLDLRARKRISRRRKGSSGPVRLHLHGLAVLRGALEKLSRRFRCRGQSCSIPAAGRSWKRCESARRNSALAFKSVTGIETVINYYGMVEQVGSVYLENPLHFLHASNYSDIIIRDTHTLEPLPPGPDRDHPGGQRAPRQATPATRC